MKNDLTQLRELLWRRKPTDAERVELRAQPEVSADLDLEIRLSETLARISEARVPSNFTARVLQAVELEEARTERLRSRNPVWRWRVFLPRVAVVLAVIGFAGVAYQHHAADHRRAELVKSVALVAEARSLPSVEALKNFDAIRRMSPATPRADGELLALLQ